MHDETVDVEALQAQIDLSNSVSYDLVSSWMKPSKETESSSLLALQLEEYAKRPPRLGLGASVSGASAATSRENAKLKGKLLGSKRPRDEGKEWPSTSAAGDLGQDDGDDDESRSAAISTKKLKQSGSQATGHGKKGKKKALSLHGESAELVPKSPAEGRVQKDWMKTRPEKIIPRDGINPPIPSEPNKLEISPTISSITTPSASLQNAVPAGSESPTSPSRRKKRHKKRAKAQEAEKELELEQEEWHGFSADVQVSLDVLPRADDISVTAQEAGSEPPTPPISKDSTPSLGPASTIRTASESPTKKRHRRRRRNRKSQGEEGKGS